MSTMRSLVVPWTLAVLVMGAAMALSGCGPAAVSGQHPGVQTPNTPVAAPEKTAAAHTRADVGYQASIPPPAATTPSKAARNAAGEPGAPLDGSLGSRPVGSRGTGLEESQRENKGLTGEPQGKVYTWEDGDRTLTVYLQNHMDIEATSARTRGGRAVEADGEELPVFRSMSGGLMTLPGGILLVLDPEWTSTQVQSFFSHNDIKTTGVSELDYAKNGFFVETQPGFPSLELANTLAALDGVLVSSPNWLRELVPK